MIPTTKTSASKTLAAPGAGRRWQPGELARLLQARMAELTDLRNASAAMANAERNLRYRGHGASIAELRGADFGKADRAIVIAAGPSLHRANPFPALAAASYDGTVIATDSAILRCLRNGVTPDLIVTLDPHDPSIVRWFGDPELDARALEDDYFRRQDMDDLFHDEERTNRELLELLGRHGPQLKIALATSAGEKVVRRAIDCGMRIYWFNPMIDDPVLPDSRSRRLYEMNGLPLVNCGGNVGTACWMIADAVLNRSHVAVAGMDFSYYAGTPYTNTQYYYEALELVGMENLDALFVQVFNPHLGASFYTDPAYLWFRDVFLELARDADCVTYNCSGGGILFGGPVRFASISEFLEASRPGPTGG
jgi:hypothetical protein